MKKIIKFFLKHCVLLLKSLRDLLKIATFAKKNNFGTVEYGKVLFIIGNGPSLNKQLENYLEMFQNNDLLCVNGMARSKWFEMLKPRYFMLLDPLYYKTGEELAAYPEDIRSDIETTINGIARKTTWALTLFVSQGLQNNKNIQTLKSNPLITVVYMNTFRFSGYDKIRDWLYVKGWAMPHCQNVLVAALYQSLLMGYSEIYLFGAEHNWTRYLYVGSDNLVHDSNKHFYAENKKSDVFFDQKGNPIRIAEVLWDFSMMFKGYEEISALNRFFGAKIYNCTPESFIDSFERKNFPDAFRG